MRKQMAIKKRRRRHLAVWSMILFCLVSLVQKADAQQPSTVSCFFEADHTPGLFRVSTLIDAPGLGLMVRANGDLFLAHPTKDGVTIEPVDTEHTGTVWVLHDIPGLGTLIGADKGLFFVHAMKDGVTVEHAGAVDTGVVDALFDIPGLGTLIGADKGLFFAHPTKGGVTVEPAGTLNKFIRLSVLHYVPGLGVLVRFNVGMLTEAGLLFGHLTKDGVTLGRRGSPSAVDTRPRVQICSTFRDLAR